MLPRARTRRALRMLPRPSRPPGALLTLAVLLLIVAGRPGAQGLDPEDFEARVDYAFFTEDANGLRNLIRDALATLEKNPASPEARYGLAFAHYRLGRLFGEGNESAAADEMSACVDELDDALDARSTAEANALQSACYAQLSALRGWSAVLTTRMSSSRLEKAIALDPRNPRVVLIDALNDLARPRALGGDRQRGAGKLERALKLFESNPGEQRGPSWGQADAWIMLGSSLLETGDTLAARNALERALLIAPEYAAARRLLAQVSGTAR